MMYNLINGLARKTPKLQLLGETVFDGGQHVIRKLREAVNEAVVARTTNQFERRTHDGLLFLNYLFFPFSSFVVCVPFRDNAEDKHKSGLGQTS